MYRKFIVLASAIVILICLGGVYAWSAYVQPLRDTYGFSSTHTQLVFGTTIAVFTLAMTWAGRLQPRYGPRRNALACALLFIAGYALAARAGGSLLLLWLGIGVISGAAIGFGYVAALATPLQWFPTHKGVVTGCAAAGFGGGAIVTAWCVDHLLAAGMALPRVLDTIGAGSGLIVLLCALALQMPPHAAIMHPPPALAVAQVLRQRLFWLLAAGMWAGTFAGLLVIGNLKSIGIEAGRSAAQANLAISLFAVGNAAGRIAWGQLYDRRGYRMIPISLAFLCASLLLLSVLHTAGVIFTVVTLLIGFGFGACFVVYAAHVAARYGTAQFSAVYPLVFIAYGIAGITGPLVGGWLHDLLGTYWWAIIIAAVIVGVGGVVCRREPRANTGAV